jgi:hypothetical protein
MKGVLWPKRWRRFGLERGKSPPISPQTPKIKLETYRCCMSESFPRFDAKKLFRGFTILDRHLQLETQWRDLHQLKALKGVRTTGTSIIPWLSTVCRAEEYRYTNIVVDDIENSIHWY